MERPAKNNGKSSLLISFGCFLLGFGIPFILPAGLSIYAFFFTKGESLGYVLLFTIVYVLPAAAVIGLILGSFSTWYFLLSPRAPLVARAGGVLVIGLIFSTVLAFVWSALAHAHRQEQRSAASDRERTEVFDHWNRTFGVKYPQAETSLPALFGPLYFQPSKLVDWKTEGYYDPQWRITIEPSAAFVDVMRHFKKVLPGNFVGNGYTPGDEKLALRSIESQRPGDGREVEVFIEGTESKPLIVYRTYPDRNIERTKLPKEAAAIPEAWPKKFEDYVAQLQPKLEGAFKRRQELFGALLYPSAELLWGDLFYWETIGGLMYESKDPMDAVQRFYMREGTKKAEYPKTVVISHPDWPRDVYLFSIAGATRIYILPPGRF